MINDNESSAIMSTGFPSQHFVCSTCSPLLWFTCRPTNCSRLFFYSKFLPCSCFFCSTGRRDEHPSGVPRPYGGGRGRGRGSYNNSSRGHNSNNERQDSGYGGSRWGSSTKDGDDGLSNFPGAKVQNSPGREAFPGGWGGASTSDNRGWGHGT